jgi:hypothetical protein
VLQLSENDDHVGILNLGTPSIAPITKSSSAALMRKAYLKLSLLIHPDKLGKTFSEATKAFQALVRALEYLSNADELETIAAEGTQAKRKADAFTIMRSNEGCYRTTVCCPRCKQPWSEGTLDGNPDYFYNFLMTGLKQFNCSTCLCEFGCVSAIHKCPFCKGCFEYSHKDFHRKITCGNPKCIKEFGFYMYHVSERVLKELKLEIKEEIERRKKSRESKFRRANSLRGREQVNEKDAFLVGLSDCCPLCGHELDEFADDEAARRHLMECNDKTAHESFARKKAKAARREEEASERRLKQDDTQALAAWELLGASSQQLYLLSEGQLKSMVKDKGLSVKGGKDELISRLVHDDGRLSIEGVVYGEQALVESRRKRKRIDATTIPSSLTSLSITELKSICAAHGIPYENNSHKIDLVQLIEDDIYGEE